jgi:hypothetical protein
MKKALLCFLAIPALLFGGLALTHCGSGGPECETDADCLKKHGAGWICNLETEKCVECAPSCTGKCCGPDGCGGTCPNNCTAPMTCDPTSCECEGPACTDDTDCTTAECCRDGACVAMDCTELECGLDPVCDKECGPCPTGETCEDGVCKPGAVTGSCPAGQACTDMTDGEGYHGCIIPPNTIPAGNQTGCDPANSIYCIGNYTCFGAEPENVCVENCGDCPDGTVCSEILEGYMGCLTSAGDMPTDAPVCGTGNPCVGNANCWTFSYTDGTPRTGCIYNCNLGYSCTTEGETRCQGEVSQTCTGGTWVDTTDCSTNSQVCNRDTGLCIPFPEIGGFCENTGLQCAEGLDCIGTSESAHAFCTPQCDCTSYTGCDAGWECLFSSGGDPPTCWCARLCTTAADCPDGGAGGYSCEVLAQDGEGNDILGCMIL